MINAFFAVGVGAACGAWLRWGLALLLNQGLIPMGTLLANLLGAYLMGLALAAFMIVPSISQDMKLLITTGFLGGLTTFSTFSAEAFTLLQRQEYGWMMLHILSHVIGSLLMIVLGYYTVQLLKS
ncbi:MAG TPA: fluoride efflux transporter CrcB [Methylophilus sp.]